MNIRLLKTRFKHGRQEHHAPSRVSALCLWLPGIYRSLQHSPLLYVPPTQDCQLLSWRDCMVRQRDRLISVTLICVWWMKPEQDTFPDILFSGIDSKFLSLHNHRLSALLWTTEGSDHSLSVLYASNISYGLPSVISPRQLIKWTLTSQTINAWRIDLCLSCGFNFLGPWELMPSTY